MRKRRAPAEVLVRQRVGALLRTLPAARQGDPGSLHQARVATRRLREVLPLVEPGARGHRLRRKVRRLTRALGPVRELDVALRTLDDMAGEAPRAAVAHLRQVLKDERRRMTAVMVRDVARVDLEKLRRRAIGAARAGRTVDGRGRAARRAVRLHSAIEAAGSIYLPDRLHDVRIAVKKLRYALELVRDVNGARGVARLHRLRQTQDLLGRTHDLEVLIARVRAVQGSPHAPTLSLSADLDRLVRRFETECRQLHAQYMTMRPALLMLCVQAAATRGRGKGRLSSAA